MKYRTECVIPWFAAAALATCSTLSQAIPKAAEHEGAQVTIGIDVAKPKLSVKLTKQPMTVKPKPAVKRKPATANKPPKIVKTVSGRK